MKNTKHILFWIFAVLSFTFKAQSPTFQWAKSIGGSSTEYGYSIAVDRSGSVYTTGTFTGTTDFDPGVGTFFLTSIGYRDIFISKVDASGNFLWAKTLGTGLGFAITTDKSGNVYTTGLFVSECDFDPGPGTYTLAALSSHATFISKLDSSGNFLWAKSIGVSSYSAVAYSNGNSITTDLSGNAYVTGNFKGTLDFDPGMGIHHLTSGFDNDMFILKLDAAGDLVWAKNMGGTFLSAGHSIAVDSEENVYTTGTFLDTADFDPGPATFYLEGVHDIFISKLDASGNFVWAKNMGGTVYNSGQSLVLDSSNNIYITGFFSGTVDFDPGIETFNLATATTNDIYSTDIFISKVDPLGNFVWCKQLGGSGRDEGRSITIDISGNIYIAGTLNGTNYLGGEIFLSKLDASANFLWAEVIGSGGSSGDAITTDACGNLYVTGSFSNTVDFNPDSTTYDLSSSGMTDVYILKLEQLPIGGSAISAISNTICNGKPLLLNVVGGSTGATASWQWYSDYCNGTSAGTGTSLVIIPDKLTTYYVRAENSCMVTECTSVTIHVKTNPKAEFESSLSASCKGITVELTNKSVNADSYFWSSGNGVSSSQENENYLFEYKSENTISLISINNNGCKDTFSLVQNIAPFSDYLDVRLPNMFTPNNDGVNDRYKVNVKADVSECFNINIFNRWGQTLFTSSDPTFEWDGKTCSGSKSPSGVYFYIIEIKDIIYKGSITLLE